MLLAIDTSTTHLVLGLLGDGIEHETARMVGRAHAEELPGALRELLQHAPPGAAVRSVIIGTGPGSYTGLRVGASFALGLGRAWSVPVLGVGTLEAVAAQAEGLVAASLDARREQVYGALYEVYGGLIRRVRREPLKQPRGEFEQLVRDATWLHDRPPSGLALARLGEQRGEQDWKLRYD